MTTPQPTRRTARGGNGRGSNGGRSGSSRTGGPRRGNNGSGGGGSSSSRNSNNNNNRQRNRAPNSPQADATATTTGLRDEEILIAFMPYLKGSHGEATRIHEDYQLSNDQQAFLKAARDFMEREQNRQPDIASPLPLTQLPPILTQPPETMPSSADTPLRLHSQYNLDPTSHLTSSFASATLNSSNDPMLSTSFSPHHFNNGSVNHAVPSSQTLGGAPINPFKPPVTTTSHALGLPIPTPSTTTTAATIAHAPIPSLSSDDAFHLGTLVKGIDDLLQDDPIVPFPVVVVPTITATSTSTSSSIWSPSPMTPPRNVSIPPNSPWRTAPLQPQPVGAAAHKQQQRQRQLQASPSPALPPPPPPLPQPLQHVSSSREGCLASASPRKAPAMMKHTSTPSPALVVKREMPALKRVWAHFHEQPGRISVDFCTGEDSSLVLLLGPRSELTANWSLPLAYLKQYAHKKHGPNVSLEQALSGLTIGLFRRGCTENGAQASIIAKAVLGDDNRNYEHWKDPNTDAICGKVPFYSPRTPGHVILRMYWDKDPLYTLAMGPTILVRVLEGDFESSVRFILSNFKGKKSNPTSLSSLHSLATVLETQITRPNESAARATWGCIQEARKVIEACAAEYNKTTARLASLEESVEDLKKQVEGEETKSQELSMPDEDSMDNVGDHAPGSLNANLREKNKMLMSGRASCERKWRDSQLALSGILKAVVSNSSMTIMLRRDLVNRMRIEYELWCPLSEEFAIPNDTAKLWYEPLRDLPANLTADDFATYAQARFKLQMRTLGFDPNTLPLEDILLPPRNNRNAQNNQRTMDAGAVSVFNNMSAAMGQSFNTLFLNEDQITRKRELIRVQTEACVRQSGAFPEGTCVAIFGSSANGFGSPNSDIDMCLQIPDATKLVEDESGPAAMAKLAEYLEQAGMKDVDTVRLTARIPIIMFRCPNPTVTGNDDDAFIECDLSMHNPLAVLNTSLLLSYAELTPVTRVLAAIIKRWAKARDINNPAHHTLSSYGYIIMLLHFLSYHRRTGNGLVMPIAPPEGNRPPRNQPNQQPTPLLPNLQWMDPLWPNFPKGAPYRELTTLPREMVPHPFEKDKEVNIYYHKPATPNDKTKLQMLFPGQDLSLAILLASFFRYYAYDFDYKRHVVSLHSTASRGLVDREVKAELDGWRNYSAALTVEDPFEVAYNIGHVLRGGYYHRIRREFAMAYTKISDAASGRAGSWNKGDLRSLSGAELLDWLCEAVERSDVESRE